MQSLINTERIKQGDNCYSIFFVKVQQATISINVFIFFILHRTPSTFGMLVWSGVRPMILK